MKHVDLKKSTQFLNQFCLGSFQREREPNEKLVEEFTKMFESLTLAGGVEKLLGSGDVNANISAATANCQIETSSSYRQSPHFVSTMTSSRRRIWNQWETCQTLVLKPPKMSFFGAQRQTFNL